MHILWLGDARCHDRALVGGKAAHLSRLAAEFHVPPGFCLTTVAHERAILEEPPADLNVLPTGLLKALATAYQVLGKRCGRSEAAVAVRSSAVDEDGAAASFAGQHETYLNVAGLGALADAVVRCWASARSERALDYRRQHGLPLDGVRLAVLVQQLVLADVSAVVFSANPVTGSPDEIVINASWGLGESIVSGTVTPDTLVVRKRDLAVICGQITDKRRMTVSVPGGTSEVEVPRFLRTQASLGGAQIAEVARLALALEATMGWPVDVECAYQGGKLYLLQCRPVTGLGTRK